MSTLSELMRRAGPQVRIRAARPRPSNSGGKPEQLILKLSEKDLTNAFDIATELVYVGVSVRTAKKILEELSEGKTTFVEAPSVVDFEDLQKKLRRWNIIARRITLRQVDVKALRARLGMSQDAFAGRYGLDVATLRNWEQGRTTPEGPAATLLQLIDSDPDKVAELLAS